MDMWQKMVYPMRRVWFSVSARLKARKNGGGLLKLHNDVQTCEYEDVQVMWEMLRRSESSEVNMAQTQTTTKRMIGFSLKYHVLYTATLSKTNHAWDIRKNVFLSSDEHGSMRVNDTYLQDNELWLASPLGYYKVNYDAGLDRKTGNTAA
ncbi:hypothetical protein FRX31_012786 [Thalictrum thalictroides]|uniref:Uncharacterized protein n=1 Tax=Thalictrum thalictroides TaxID=46969 RepID=A0A7J6WJQ7_THATH|nr:hypothetical protein FRX31_012786 [Thalictrum thalictroides]